jgi:hypothetical protein
LDLIVTATRRPDLIKQTLLSIDKHFLFEFENVFINLDPLFGTEKDHLLCIENIKKIHPNAVINEPATANFCAAVKYGWSCVTSSHALYTEDDWLWKRSYDKEFLTRKNVGICRFNCKENLDRIRYGTSPSVITKQFAHEASDTLDIRYDPEKQYDINEDLKRVVEKHGVDLFEEIGLYDIGRRWRLKRNIKKVIDNRQTTWVYSPSIISTLFKAFSGFNKKFKNKSDSCE